MSMIEATSTDLRTSGFLRIVSAIETATTLDELLLLTLNEFCQLLNVSQAAMLLLREDGQSTRVIGTYPPRVTLPPPLPIAETPFLRQAIEQRQAVQIYDIDDLPNDSSHYIHLMRQAHIRSLVIFPMVAQDHVTGTLILGTEEGPRHFPDNEIAIARMLTGQLSAALNTFRTIESAQRRSDQLATLNDIASAVTSSLDTQEIYHLVVQKLNEYFRVEAGSLLMRDPHTGDLEFVMTLEAGVEKLAGVKVPRGQGVVGLVAESQHYEIVLDAQHDPRFYRKISDAVGYQTHSILCVPMIVKGRTIGVIELLNKQEGDFTEEDANRLMHMATTIGVALENARLFQEVANGRDRLEAILNANNDGILMADMHGLIVTANPKAAALLQIPQDNLLGQNLERLLATLRARALDVTVPSWLNESVNTSDVLELELNEPTHCFVRQLSLPVRDTNAQVIGQLTLLQDISGERELTQLRDDYTGMLVHDLRAPLTAIMNGITLVRRGMGGPVSPQQDELLGIAYHASQTMLEMVNTLLDISKMEQGHLTLTIDPFAAAEMLEETRARLQASANNHHQTIHIAIQGEPPDIEGDREKVMRVLQNLLDNAIKFSPSNSEIVLGVAAAQVVRTADQITLPDSGEPPLVLPELPRGTYIAFWVRDQGPGIPPQYRERIFEKFGQIRGHKVRGTGLGLTFCKLAVEAHGGRIWLQSIEGEGSTFAFVLPLKAQVREES